MEKSGIVAFAFGAPRIIFSNRIIAEITSQKAQGLKAPIVYTQYDVGFVPVAEVRYADEKPGNPLPTLRIARGTIQWAKQHGLVELWVVAAKPHLWRCVRDLKYAVEEAGMQIQIRVCKEIEQYPEDSWFCSNSTHARTRSRKNWQRRERILRLLPMFLYKRVAS